MNLIKHISKAFRCGFGYWRLAVYVFGFQFLLSLSIGILTYNYIQGAIGHSVNLLKIIDGYDHDVFQDLLLYEGTGWTMIKTFMVAVVVFYLIAGPYISGGFLEVYRNKSDHWKIFWHGGSIYYIPFLIINLAITGFVLIVGGGLAWLGILLMNYGLENFPSEIPVLICWLILIFFFILTIIISVSVSYRAKLENSMRGIPAGYALIAGMKFTYSKIFYFLSLGLILLVFTSVFVICVNLLINSIQESGFLLVIFALFIQLLTIYIKVCIRHTYLFAILQKSGSEKLGTS